MDRMRIRTECICLFLLALISAGAQNPSCPSTLAYFISGGNIRAYDPNQPFSASNPSSINITSPGSTAMALALLPNINGGTLSPTFYSVLGSTYHYWSGSGWINTGHSTGNGTAINIGGCGGTIYNVAYSSVPPIVYTYNGASNGTSLCTLPTGIVADLVVDCDCNFYVFNPQVPNQALIKYSPAGVVQASFALNGIPNASGGGGFALIGNKVYYPASSQLYAGLLGGSTINFTAVTVPSTNPFNGADWASCPFGVPIGITASNDSICTGNSVILTANGANSYTWMPSGTNSSVVIVNPVQGNNIFTVTAASATANCLSQAAIPIIGIPIPTINVNVTSPTVCSGQTLQLSASGANTYSWQPTGTGASFSISATTSGVYTVTGTSTNSCSSQATVQVQVDPTPTVSVSGNTLACKGDKVVLNASGASTYSWNGVPGAASYSIIAGSNATLTVQGKAGTVTCTGSTAFTFSVKICSDIIEESPDGKVMISPNPAKERIRILNIGNPACTLFNAKGEEVGKLAIDINGEADVSQLSHGLYFLRINHHHSYLFVKFIKD